VKSYKTPAVKDSDAHGQVQEFVKPKAPTPPSTDLAGDLEAYKTQAVEIEGQAAPSESGAAPVEEDWLEIAEDEEPAAH
jgi:F-type H+-transporting ATPase subunit h